MNTSEAGEFTHDTKTKKGKSLAKSIPRIQKFVDIYSSYFKDCSRYNGFCFEADPPSVRMSDANRVILHEDCVSLKVKKLFCCTVNKTYILMYNDRHIWFIQWTFYGARYTMMRVCSIVVCIPYSRITLRRWLTQIHGYGSVIKNTLTYSISLFSY